MSEASGSGLSWGFVFTALWAQPSGAALACPTQPSLPSPLFQDALLSLGSVIDVAGLRRAAKEALSAVLPRVVGASPCPALPSLPQSLAQGQRGGEEGGLSRGPHGDLEGLGVCPERASWRRRAAANTKERACLRIPQYLSQKGS